MSWRRRDREITAAHEAGHVVTSIVINEPFGYATIIKDSNVKGHVNHNSSIFFGEAWFLKPQVSVLSALAGMQTQKYFFPRSLWRGSGRDDWENAADLLREKLGLQGKELEVELHRLSDVAARLVHEHQAEIQKVAAVLLERKTLNENEVRVIMGRPPRQPRSCGPCSLCCKLLGVGEPLHKPAGKWCEHCRPSHDGCLIYDSRPEECRDYLCGWRGHSQELVTLGAEWFPGTCGMVWSQMGTKLHVDPVNPNRWREEPYYSQLKEIAADRLQESQYLLVVVSGGYFLVLPNEDRDVSKEVREGYNNELRVRLRSDGRYEVTPAYDLSEGHEWYERDQELLEESDHHVEWDDT